MRLSGSRDAAADLLQSCAMKALAAVPPEEDERVRAWLFTIPRNLWIDEHRCAQASVPDAAEAEAPAGGHWRDQASCRAFMRANQAFHEGIATIADHARLLRGIA